MLALDTPHCDKLPSMDDDDDEEDDSYDDTEYQVIGYFKNAWWRGTNSKGHEETVTNYNYTLHHHDHKLRQH